MFDPKKIKSDFPILKTKINGKTLCYLDSAASSQKPKVVIETIKDCYENYYANIHRGIYELSEKSTAAYEDCRETVAKFLKAKSAREIIFTRNCTESINLIAYTWGEKNIKAGDEIVLSALEHHANLVPWQELARRKKAKLKIIPLRKDLELDLSAYKKLLNKKTKLVAITAMSNALGTIPDLKTIITEAHKKGAKVLVDGAQSIAHQKTDVRKMNCDFFAFSAHKMLGPSGVGVLYVKEEILKEIPPFLTGGEMIREVKAQKSTWNDYPWKFEAGTPNIADTIAFQKAIEYLEKIGLQNIHKHEQNLRKYAIQKLSKHPEVTLFTPKKGGGIISFSIKGIHPHDIATIFNEEGVCIRAGHHCAQPLMETLKVPATARISFYLYNTKEDIDQAEKALKKTINIFK